MPARVANITFDCADALRLAEFWSEVIGRPLDAGGSRGFASIGTDDPDRSAPAWLFEAVPEAKTAKNRMHLDLADADPRAVDRLVGLGATFVSEHELGEGGHRWTVLRDPEGNEFCIAEGTYTG